MTHDYKRTRHHDAVCRAERARRHGHRRNMQRHRHQEFIRFLNAIEAQVPAGKAVHVIVDNYAAHKHPEGPRLARPPRTLHLPLHPNLMLLAECG